MREIRVREIRVREIRVREIRVREIRVRAPFKRRIHERKRGDSSASQPEAQGFSAR